MSVHDKRDRIITCEFCGDLHLTSLLEGHLKKVCVKFKTKTVVFSVLSLLNGWWAPDSPDWTAQSQDLQTRERVRWAREQCLVQGCTWECYRDGCIESRGTLGTQVLLGSHVMTANQLLDARRTLCTLWKKVKKNKRPIINTSCDWFFELWGLTRLWNGYCSLPFKNLDTTSCCGMLSSLKEPI